MENNPSRMENKIEKVANLINLLQSSNVSNIFLKRSETLSTFIVLEISEQNHNIIVQLKPYEQYKGIVMTIASIVNKCKKHSLNIQVSIFNNHPQMIGWIQINDETPKLSHSCCHHYHSNIESIEQSIEDLKIENNSIEQLTFNSTLECLSISSSNTSDKQQVVETYSTLNMKSTTTLCNLAALILGIDFKDEISQLLNLCSIMRNPLEFRPCKSFLDEFILTGDIRWLSYITYMDISNRDLVQLPKVIHYFTRLKTLVLVANQLTSLPFELQDLRLVEIQLQGNNLSQFPVVLITMATREDYCLLYIYVGNNPMKRIPKELKNFVRPPFPRNAIWVGS